MVLVAVSLSDIVLPPLRTVSAVNRGGRAFDEATVLRTAHTLERSMPWGERRAGLAS